MSTPPVNASARSRAGQWAVRAVILAAWLVAFVQLIDTTALAAPSPNQSAFAAFQAVSLLALALALVFICVARHRPELGWPTLIAAAALTLQLGSAWLYVPTPAATPLGPVLPAPRGPDAGALLASLATAAALVLILLHAAWILTPADPSSRSPFRSRLRALGRALTFNPLTTLFGPVFQKEVRVAGRRRGTYLARTLYPLFLLTISAIAYFIMLATIDEVSGAARLQRLQDLAPQLAMVIAWCQFAVLAFIAPVMTSSAICDERRQLTLAALMTTPMTSSQIIFGKLASRLVLVLILALVSTPLLLAVRIYGGLDAEIIVATTCISLSAAVLGASLGLLYSVWHRRAATAAIFGLLTMLLFALGVIVAFIVTMMRTNLPPGGWVFGLSAPLAMVGTTFALLNPPPGVDPDAFLREVWVTSTVVNLALALFTCSAATLALRSILHAEAAGSLSSLDKPSRPRARSRRAAPTPPPPAPADGDGAADPTLDSEPAQPPDDDDDDPSIRTGIIRAVGDRPVLWREVRQASFGSRRRLMIVAGAVALAAGGIYWRVPFSDPALHMVIGMIGLFVVVLLATMASTASVAGEHESRTWQVLLTTTLSAREIIAGKFLGALRRQWFVPACLAAHFSLAVASGNVHPIAAVHLAMICAAVAILLTGTGILLSLLLRRSSAAAVCNMLLALGLWLMVPIGTVTILEITDEFRGGGSSDEFITAFLVINPFALAAIALEPMVEASSGAPGPRPYELPIGRISAQTFTTILAATTTLGAAIGLACTFAATLLFRRVGGRIS